MAHATLGSPEPAAKPRLRCADGRHRRRLIVVLCIVGVALAVGVAVAVAIAVLGRSRMTSSSGGGRAPRGRAPTEAIARTCGVTLYPELCVGELMAFPGAAGAGDAELVPMSLNATHRRVVDVLYNATALGGAAALLAGARSGAAYGDCVEMLDAAEELLARSVGAMAAPPPPPDSVDADTAGRDDDDIMTWLSAALTSHDTCMDSLQEVGAGDDDGGRIKPQMLGYLGNLGEHLSNSLAIFAARGRPGGELSDVPVHNQLHRRLLTIDDDDDDDGSFPRWVRHNDRRLLQAAAAEIEADMVVAKDGTGTHRKIRDAIKAAPEHSRRRVVIYVKAGVYTENVKIGSKKTNLMLVGDGAGKTVVVGYRSVHDNYTTFHTATLAVAGAGFIMRDMTVENRAGAARHQAVALLVSGDHAVVYRSAVLGYQDTLYAHAQRQFYRDCDVAGTVDFVFGNAAVVLQNCTLWARRPLPGQENTVTAQGRRDPNQSTGISVHGCRLLPSPELELAPAARRGRAATYLGRPWKPYSRAVYMMSYMAGHVHAAGWLAWDASGRAPDTLYYGEYRNSGPGAAVGGRVPWPGHRVIKLPEEAMEFTVGRFIGGYSWLPPTGVAFVAGLTV